MFVAQSHCRAGLPAASEPWRIKTFILLLFSFSLCTYSAFAAQVTLSWHDPDNAPQDISGYYVYYWQESWDTPARVAVPPAAIPYTLTGLEAGQTYHFAVTAYDQNRGRESARSNEVHLTIPALAPLARFRATSTPAGPLPLTVNFADTSTGNITSRSWAFGDGGTSAAKNPSHTYTAPGTYTVRLRVRGPYGLDTAMRIGYITVSASATGLVAAYNFHARSGTMLTDLSGNANHGRVSGAIWTSQGKVGRALAFDGMNDWVTIANAPSLALGSRGTIAAWVKLTTLGRWQSILAKGSTNNDAAHNYALEITPTNVIRCILGNGTTYLQLDASLTPIPGQFYHLACTWDETTVRLYVNGILNESTAQTLTPVGNTAPLFLGKFGGNIDWLKGTIDEMRIYKRALTTREVRADMRAPVGALPSDAHPPTVSLTAPASGTTVAGSSVAVAATASDNMGIVGVQFLLDGVKIGNEDTTAPYTISWDTTTVPDGFHTVTARARDAAGNRTTSARVRVTVQNLPPPPVATFRATPTSGTAPLSVTFTDQSTGTITSRRWNFGDGHTSMARNPTHIYTTPATYTVRLSVTGPGGTRTSSRTDYIRITPPNTTTEFFEFGDVLADSTWHTVTFRRPFVNPVVVAKPLSNNGRDPAIVRIRNVTPTGFELRIQEWDYLDDVHRQETAGYLVVERGQYTLGGTVPIEAGSLVTNQTNFVTVPWSQSFAVAPVVLTAVASANGGEAVTTRIRNVNRNTFQVRLQEQEKNLQHHALETITYIAWPPSSGVLADSLVFEVHKTPNIMTHRLQTLTFLQDFTAIPVFLADLQTTDGSDPASLRWENKGFFGVDVKVAEEQSAASEIQHTTEVVGYIALAFHNITADSDGDGLTNADEILQYGTDPADVDTDQDGLNDGQEVRFWGTRWNADPDRDGLINLLDLDSDNDGVLDGEEH